MAPKSKQHNPLHYLFYTRPSTREPSAKVNWYWFLIDFLYEPIYRETTSAGLHATDALTVKSTLSMNRPRRPLICRLFSTSHTLLSASWLPPLQIINVWTTNLYLQSIKIVTKRDYKQKLQGLKFLNWICNLAVFNTYDWLIRYLRRRLHV